jgi:beta-N-acetylhexosaminidase
VSDVNRPAPAPGDGDDLRRLATSILLPATEAAELDDRLLAFFGAGGRSLLLGESREEYVARRMSPDRERRETAAMIATVIARAHEVAGAPVLIGLDAEIGGIERLAHLVGRLPSQSEAIQMSNEELAKACRATAEALRALGVSLVMAPILDVLDAPNRWLDGRHLGPAPNVVERVGVAFIEAFESAGVATTAKHFPGHRGLLTDPAVEPEAVVPGDRESALADLQPFRAAIRAGVSCVMTGPGTVEAFDPDRPALLSPSVVSLLREDGGFDGLVVSDDLDAASVLHGRGLDQALVEALQAGNDLMMVAASNDLAALSETVVAAVEDGRVDRLRLEQAAARVDRLASLSVLASGADIHKR